MNYEEVGEKAFFNLLKEVGIHRNQEGRVSGLELKASHDDVANIAHTLMVIQTNLFVVDLEVILALYGDGNNEYLILKKYEDSIYDSLEKNANVIREALLNRHAATKKQTVKE